jgi:MFS transporter, DHA1 family, multidrug resistance protein
VTGRWTLRGLLTEYVLAFTGYFALVPVLPVLLREVRDLRAVQVGAALVVFTLAARAGSLLVAPLLHLASRGLVLVAAPALTGLSAAVLALGPPLPLLLACLATAGLGVSVNGLVVRVHLAERESGDGRRLRSFALLNVALNLAGAVGPLLGTALYDRAAPGRVLGTVAALYAGAVLVSLPLLRAAGGSGIDSGRRFSPRAYARVLRRSPELRRLLLVTVLGWALYAQLFSALPLYLFRTVERRALIGTVFVLGAVLIVTCQLLVTRVVTRRIEAGTPAERVLLAGIGLFPCSFLLVGASGGRLAVLYPAIAVFTLGEILFTPLVDTALARHGEDEGYVAVFAGKQVTVAVGESVGAFLGGTGFLFVSGALDSDAAYWFAAAAVGLAAVLALAARPRRVGQNRSVG